MEVFMDGFIQGGRGEVRLGDILTAQLRGAGTRALKEAYASMWEEQHPNVLVIRDWEEVTDETIEQLLAEGRKDEAEQALEDRAALEERRSTRSIDVRPEPTLGMDPERAQKELRRQYANMQGLDPAHPDYERLWANTRNAIWQLEDICEIKRTVYQKGQRPRTQADPIPPELQEKLNKYALLPLKKRETAIVAVASAERPNTELLRLIGLYEADNGLRELVTVNLAKLGAL